MKLVKFELNVGNLGLPPGVEFFKFVQWMRSLLSRPEFRGDSLDVVPKWFFGGSPSRKNKKNRLFA